ncbi:MAG: MerR family transcriptional regulator [Deltaproteobacteria bacterium]|jgi:hypothetical protein|nr:MerR family transcriptional regulator [Deltaproteobacteria bacterium]
MSEDFKRTVPETAPEQDAVYYQVQDMAIILDLREHVVRNWLKNLPQIVPYKLNKRKVLYTRTHLALVREVKRLVTEGYSLQGACAAVTQRQRKLPHLFDWPELDAAEADASFSDAFIGAPRDVSPGDALKIKNSATALSGLLDDSDSPDATSAFEEGDPEPDEDFDGDDSADPSADSGEESNGRRADEGGEEGVTDKRFLQELSRQFDFLNNDDETDLEDEGGTFSEFRSKESGDRLPERLPGDGPSSSEEILDDIKKGLLDIAQILSRSIEF